VAPAHAAAGGAGHAKQHLSFAAKALIMGAKLKAAASHKSGGPTLSSVSEGLRADGLKSSQMLIFIDCSRSNADSGRLTFGGRSLHDVSGGDKAMNPYQQVLSIVGRTLAPFDADGLIPCFGFGDKATTDKGVFPFFDESARPGGGPAAAQKASAQAMSSSSAASSRSASTGKRARAARSAGPGARAAARSRAGRSRSRGPEGGASARAASARSPKARSPSRAAVRGSSSRSTPNASRQRLPTPSPKLPPAYSSFAKVYSGLPR
jgi:hypothetical protein